MRTVAMVVALASLGCNQVLGLDPPSLVDASSEPPPLDARPDAAADCTDPGGAPDEDGDLVRDACDNCPHRAQTTAADRVDLDGDGIGAQCDPNLFGPDEVVAFLAFNAPSPDLSLILGGQGAWGFDDGDLILNGTVTQTAYLAALAAAVPQVTVEAEVTLPATLALLAASSSRSVGVWANLDLTTPISPTPSGNLVEVFEARGEQNGSESAAHLVDTTPGGTGVTAAASPPLFMPAARYHLTLTCGAGQCSTVVRRDGIVLYSTSNPSNTRAGGVGLRSYSVDARFHYLMVYAPGM